MRVRGKDRWFALAFAFAAECACMCTLRPALVHAEGPPPAGPGSTPAGTGDDQDAKARAKTQFESGVAAYDAGRYEDALASFQEAFRIRPHPLVRVNIANCYDKLGKPLEALFHFDQFITAQVGTPEQRKEVLSAMERLRKQVGQVMLRVSPDGALVTIDGGEQRRAPIMDAISLTAGKHELDVRLDGYQPLQRSVTVQGGATAELSLVLSRAGDAAATTPPPVAVITPAPQVLPSDQPAVAQPPASPEPEPPPAAEPVPVPPPVRPEPVAHAGHGPGAEVWIIGGVSVALLLAGSVTGIIALDAESDFDQALRERLDPNATGLARQAAYERALDAMDRADALALTTDILLLGALAGAGVTTVLLLNANDGADEAETALVPSVAPHAFSVQLTRTF